MNSVLQKQRDYFHSGRTLSLERRLEALRRLRNLVERNSKLLSEALFNDLRKSSAEAWVTEIGFVLHEIDFVMRELKSWMPPQRMPKNLVLWPSESEVHYEPHGACLIISPWNYPVQLSLSPVVGALAAGNTVILKPSELTPFTSAALKDLFAREFSEYLVSVQTGDRTVSQALLRESFDFIFFTGGTEVGREVMRAAADHLTPVCLELGGKSPCVLARDVDLKKSLKRILWGKFLNAGQTCVAPDYLYVPEELMVQVAPLAGEILKEFFGTNPELSPDFGRIVNERHFDRLEKLLPEGRILIGGTRDRASRYVAPTLVGPVTWDDACMKEEIFGPILPVLSYQNLKEVYAAIRRQPNPLAAYVFTNHRELEREFLKEVRSGGACINDTVLHLSDLHLPFGGRGPSGIGAYHGRKSFECFSHQRAVLRRRLQFDWSFRYPPLAGMRGRILRAMMRFFS